MAYRYLEVGDHVKVKFYKHFGKFGIVEHVNGYYVVVAIYDNVYNRNIVDRLAVGMSSLLVANLPAQNFNYNTIFLNSVVDTKYNCEYDGWTHEDLVERIKQLEAQLDEIEGNS